MKIEYRAERALGFAGYFHVYRCYTRSSVLWKGNGFILQRGSKGSRVMEGTKSALYPHGGPPGNRTTLRVSVALKLFFCFTCILLFLDTEVSLEHTVQINNRLLPFSRSLTSGHLQKCLLTELLVICRVCMTK